ncbi:helix-turn-helix domain-containing protein [Sulfitobacter pontiacus]|uniref:helix-turn-helix domain-containing protein n=1 Tax=Sulfitobacter pontiacus TaxID=60137 RepID=UPI00315B0872
MTKRSPLDLLQKWHVSQYWARQQPLLTRTAFLVLLRLLDRQNTKTGRCDPSAIGLCEEMGLSERGVRGAFKELESRGALKRRHVAKRARNQFLIFSVDEIAQNQRLTKLKLRAGARTGVQPVAVPAAVNCRINLKRTAPEQIKETIKKNDKAENMEATGPTSLVGIGGRAVRQIDLGEFERRAVKVFERKGYGYEGLLMIPAGKFEQTFESYRDGIKSFGQSIGDLLDAYILSQG